MEPKILGKARGYREFVAILRAFLEEEQITRETLDEHSGLTARHAAKLLTPIPIKNFGPISLTLLLQSCGLELWVVQRPDSPIDELPKARFVRKRGASSQASSRLPPSHIR